MKSRFDKDVYYHEYCDVHPTVLEAKRLPIPKSELAANPDRFCPSQDSKNLDEWWSDAVMEFFRLQESKLLLQGEEKTARLRELHGQSVILRGAALNGLVLSTLCFFGFCASFRRRSTEASQAAGTSTTMDPLRRGGVLMFGAYSLVSHFRRQAYHDPPLAEGVIMLLGIAGLLSAATRESRWRYARGCGLSFALTLIAYGAWWWSEVMYNQTVIHAYQTL